MDTKKVTILIIGNDDQEVKSFKVNSDLIANFKKYLFGAAALTLVTVILVVSLVANSIRVSLNNSSLNSQINTMNTKLETYDSLGLQQKINKIDNNLSMIDSYLQGRGLMELGNAGGEKGSDKVNGPFLNTQPEMVDHLEKQSVVFYQRLKDLPLGYPYDGVRSSDYGYRKNPFGGFTGEFHPGVDLKGAVGDPIYATGDGVINRCDYYGGYGNAVVIDHKSGFQSLYGHLTRVNVVQGQQIKAGDVIGYLGSTGRSTGPHVHYEIRKDGDDISPEPFLKIY